MTCKALTILLLLFVAGCGRNPPEALPPEPPPEPVPPPPAIEMRDATPLDVARAVNHAMADTVENVLPAVVVIRTESTRYFVDWYGRLLREAQRPVGQGSGVIIDPEGYVLTNFHVLHGGQRIEVILEDGTAYPATLVGKNEPTDIAVLRIESEEERTFPTIEAGDSDKIRVGEMVMAIGSPFSLSSTVTQGVISHKGRSESFLPIVDFIQTSAAINPGNSGGPLIDIEGRLIGINTLIRTAGGMNQGNIGIGFAVPSNTAMRAAELIIGGTEGIEFSWLGVVMQDTREGVLLTRIVKNSPADEAGLEAGDLVRRVNRKSIRSGQELSSIVRLGRPGDILTLEIIRNNRSMTVPVTTSLMPQTEIQFR